MVEIGPQGVALRDQLIEFPLAYDGEKPGRFQLLDVSI
jgi:hypothetical protein